MKKIDQAHSAYRKGSGKKNKENGLLKTSIEPADMEQTVSEQKLPLSAGYAKAAKFLLLIGPRQASEVLKHVPEKDVEKIVKEIASVSRIEKSDSRRILKEFGYSAPGKKSAPEPSSGPIQGGPEQAREMLQTAFGEEKGNALFKKVLPFGGRKPFDFLNELHPEQVLMVIRKEPPYVMSTVLSFLEPDLSSQIISELPPESRKEIVLRIARQGDIAPGIIEKMETVFRDRIRAQGRVVSEEIDGKSVLAGILRHMDLGSEEKILDDLTGSDSGLAGEIKDRIYTIDMLLQMEDRDVQTLLRDFDNMELAVIIKGKPDEIRSRILDSISERRRLMVEEESLHLGEMLRSDVDKSTKELVGYMMELEQKGLIMIPRGDEEYI